MGLIPHSLEHIPALHAMGTVLIGIVLFFILEKLVVWRHCHNQQCEVHGSAGPLLLAGDAFHNLVVEEPVTPRSGTHLLRTGGAVRHTPLLRRGQLPARVTKGGDVNGARRRPLCFAWVDVS